MQTTESKTKAISFNRNSIKAFVKPQSLDLKVQWGIFRAVLVVADFLIISLALLFAYIIRFQFSIPVFRLEVNPSILYYNRVAYISAGILIILFTINGLYRRENLMGGTEEYALVFNTTTLGLLIVITSSFLLEDFVLARGWVLLAWFLVFFMVALERFILRRVIYRLRRLGYFLSPAVIVGANREGLELAQQFLNWRTSGFHLVGFIDEYIQPGTLILNHLSCLGRIVDLDEIIGQHKIQEIILASSSHSSYQSAVEIFKKYGVQDNIKLRFSSGFNEFIATGLTVKDFSFVPLMEVNPVRLMGIDQFLKYMLDYCLVIPGLILLSPFLLTIAILIKLDSPGPVIYRRRVMGVRGKQFDAYKFRTMHQNGDQILEANPELKLELEDTHKLKDDPRITRIGKYLRKFSIDEFPQLINVLRGEMSLVGPRMISPPELEKYEQWDINLLTVRPGITGLWQISGRSDVSYEERVRLDMQYIRNWNIWLDLQILFRTIPAVIKGKGAY
jgi:exopolysaccharide biosynthesis polyprenyl glycosylphosphotransferase